MEPSHHIWCFGTTVIDPIKQAAKLTSSRGPPNSPKWIILFHLVVAYSQLDITNFPTLHHEAKSVFRKKIDRFFFLSRNKQIGLQLTSKESCHVFWLGEIMLYTSHFTKLFKKEYGMIWFQNFSSTHFSLEFPIPLFKGTCNSYYKISI